MNYLQGVQRLSSECGIAGSGPSATTGQAGTNLRLVNWYNTAWMEIQQLHDDWKFMRSSFTVNTVADDGAYVFGDCTDTATSTAIVNFRKWHLNTFKQYLQSSGVGSEIALSYIDYDSWYREYNTGTQTSSTPQYFTIDHSNGFRLAPKPSAVYVVSGEFQHSATELSGDSDTPELPTEFHMAIVYAAMKMYGAHYSAPEVYERGRLEYSRMMNRMEWTQLPEILIAGPLT